MKIIPIFSLAVFASVICATRGAKAQNLSPWPYNETCSSTSDCFSVTQTSTQSSDLQVAISGSGQNGCGGLWGGTDTGDAVAGWADSGRGVAGLSNTGTGVYGYSASQGNGVFGFSLSSGASGVYGENDRGGYGVVGRVTPAGAGIAIYGDNDGEGGAAGWFHGEVTVTGNLDVYGKPSATQSTFSSVSDVRLKKNVQPLTGALDRLLQLHGVTYEWKDPAEHANQTGTQRGFVGQEVEKVMPEWVTVDDKGFKSISIPGRGLEAMTIESIRTLKMENDALKDRVKALEAGRRPLISGMGEGGIGFGMLALAGALVITRRRHS